MASISGTALNFTSGIAKAKTPEQRKAALKEAAQEVVGTAFLGEMMKLARETPFKSKMFHGGQGEDMFRSQLDAELSRRASGKLDSGLSDAIVKRLSNGS